MTSHTLYMTSHTWQHKCFICHLTHYIWHYFHCICVIKPSVSIIPHPLSVGHHMDYMYDIIFSMCGITWTLYDITPLDVWHHIQYIYDIISKIYGITHTAFMKTQLLFLRSHPPYLTSQPLHLCCHTSSIDAITTVMEVITLGTRMISYTLYIMSHSHLWHQSSVVMTSQPLHSWHHISYIWHHIHGLWHLIPYTCDLMAIISVT